MDGLKKIFFICFTEFLGLCVINNFLFQKKSPYKVICVTPLTGRYYIYLYIYIFIYNIYIILHVYVYVYFHIYFYVYFYIYMDIYMDIEVAVRTLPQESRLFKYKKK